MCRMVAYQTYKKALRIRLPSRARTSACSSWNLKKVKTNSLKLWKQFVSILLRQNERVYTATSTKMKINSKMLPGTVSGSRQFRTSKDSEFHSGSINSESNKVEQLKCQKSHTYLREKRTRKFRGSKISGEKVASRPFATSTRETAVLFTGAQSLSIF